MKLSAGIQDLGFQYYRNAQSFRIGAEYVQDSLTDNDFLTLKAAAGDQKNKFIFKYISNMEIIFP